MAYQGIGTGTTPNDGTGDDLLSGAVKINSNFQEIYNALGDGTDIDLNTNKVPEDILEATNLYFTNERAQDAVGSAINVGIKTGIEVTYDDVNNRINFSNYNITTTSSNKTLTNLEYCTVTQNNLTITLPSSPSVGDKAMIGISSNFNNTTIARNGSNIMSLTEDMVVDSGYVTLTMIYINSTLGWRIS